MTEYVTLDEIKSQVLVDKWFTDDDDYLISLRSVAEDIVSKEIDMHKMKILQDINLRIILLKI